MPEEKKRGPANVIRINKIESGYFLVKVTYGGNYDTLTHAFSELHDALVYVEQQSVLLGSDVDDE